MTKKKDSLNQIYHLLQPCISPKDQRGTSLGDESGCKNDEKKILINNLLKTIYEPTQDFSILSKFIFSFK